MKKRLTLIMFLLSILFKANSQNCDAPDELFRKRHIIDGMTWGHPYTTFDRHNKLTLEQTIQNIREKIIQEKSKKGSIYKAYQIIYEDAKKQMPSDNGMPNDGLSYKAAWAKNNAFIFLIGLDDNIQKIDSIDTSGATRNAFKQHALDAFDNITGKIDANNPAWAWWILPVPVVSYFVANAVEEEKFLSKIQNHSRSLILWLQAYDLLKASAEVSELRSANRNWYTNRDSDRNKGGCSPRNKLRKLTRDLYYYSEGKTGIINHAFGWKKNHGIAAASALLMAAQVLNDAGVETSYLNLIASIVFPLYGLVHGFYEPIPHPKYSPINWNEVGQKGIHNNLFDGDHWWPSKDVPQAPYKTYPDSYSPYAEGPGYTQYGLLDCGIPAMVSQRNLYPTWTDEPFLKKDEIKNIFNWYDRLRMDDNQIPTYDNTHIDTKCNLLALTGIAKYNKGTSDGMDKFYLADFVAMVGGNQIQTDSKEKEFQDIMPDAGNAILRSKTEDANHYLLMLYENGMEVDEESYTNLPLLGSEGTHEDDDLGSFMIYAGDKGADMTPLAIDPPYITWDKGNGAAKTNKYEHHNVIQFGKTTSTPGITLSNTHIVGNPSVTDIHKFDGLKQSFNLNYLVEDFNESVVFDWWPPFTINTNASTGVVRRNTNMYNTHGVVYYILNDYIRMPSNYTYAKLSINGNGNISETFSSTDTRKTMIENTSSNRTAIWRHPCTYDKPTWGLYTHYAALGANTDSLSFTPITATDINGATLHHDKLDKITFNKGSINSEGYGFHTRLNVQQNTNKTIFQTLLFPYRCSEESKIPQVSKYENDTHVVTIIQFDTRIDTVNASWANFKTNKNNSTGVADTISHLHYARWEGNINDTIKNSAIGNFYTDAVNAFIENHSLSWNKTMACSPSYIKPRHIAMEYGKYLAMDSITYIEASSNIKLNYYFVSKYQYAGTMQNVGTDATVTLYLPDVTPDVTDMTAYTTGGLSLNSTYNADSNKITFDVPAGDLGFVIKQANPCVNCYFPKTSETIDSTFWFDDGSTQTLGHKLDVVKNRGHLKVLNSSKMQLCCGIYFRNKDTISMQGPCGTKELITDFCKGIDTLGIANSDKSMIVVNSGTALVLESGSYTYVGNNSGIYVRNGGSLIIKDNSFLRIGDTLTCGKGEIIAESGAYIYIQPLAHIEFNKTIGDTVDKHMFYIKLPPAGAAMAGVNYGVDTLLKQDTIIDTVYTATPICDLNTTMSPAVHNNDWGFANFAKPRTFMRMRNDTLCPGEPLYIDLKRFLNENSFKFKVCRMDSMYLKDAHTNIYSWVDTCIEDTMSHDTTYPDPVCTPPRAAPDYLLYYFKTNSLHRITMEAMNDCGLKSDTTAYVFVMDTPKVSISMPSEICEGVGTATAYITKFNNFPISSYTFEITEIPDTALMKVRTGITQSFSKTYYDTLPDSFDFDDYYFKGGRKYSISLTVTSACGGETFYTETTVPLAAKIVAGKPTVYAEPIAGATSVKLQGYIRGADSFTWTPNDWLNRTDTLSIISTPHESVSYILSAYKGACVARDTISIRYNELSNIGTNDTLCYDSSAIALGNHYNAAMFLGWLQYYDVIDVNTELRNIIANLNNDDIYFDRYLKYFDSYMLAGRFKESQDTSCFAYYDLFKNNETYNWDMIFKDSQFVL